MNEEQPVVTTKTDIKGKGPAKRNSEIRKEQNRVASRNYREKRRQKLALLDQILKTEDGSEQGQGAPSSSDGVGSVAGENGWAIPALVSPENAFIHEVVDGSRAWLPASNTSNAEPDMSLQDVMPGQDWADLVDTVPTLGISQVAVPNVYGEPSMPPSNLAGPHPCGAWQDAGQSLGESFNTTLPTGYAALEPGTEPAIEACAASTGVSPEQAMGCIIKRIGNLTPSQKGALITLLQQDAYNADATNCMPASGPTDSI